MHTTLTTTEARGPGEFDSTIEHSPEFGGYLVARPTDTTLAIWRGELHTDWGGACIALAEAQGESEVAGIDPATWGIYNVAGALAIGAQHDYDGPQLAVITTPRILTTEATPAEAATALAVVQALTTASLAMEDAPTFIALTEPAGMLAALTQWWEATTVLAEALGGMQVVADFAHDCVPPALAAEVQRHLQAADSGVKDAAVHVGWAVHKLAKVYEPSHPALGDA